MASTLFIGLIDAEPAKRSTVFTGNLETLYPRSKLFMGRVSTNPYALKSKLVIGQVNSAPIVSKLFQGTLNAYSTPAPVPPESNLFTGYGITHVRTCIPGNERAYLTGGGSIWTLRSATVTCEAGNGWSWSAQLVTSQEVTLSRLTPYRITLEKNGRSWTSPPLKISRYSRCDHKRTCTNGVLSARKRTHNIGGLSLTSWNATNNNVSFDTYLGAYIRDILRDVSLVTGLHIVNAPDWWVLEEDIHNSKAWEVLRRYARVSGTDLVEDLVGRIVFVPATATTGNLTLKPKGDICLNIDEGRCVDQIQIEKTSRLTDRIYFNKKTPGHFIEQLPFPCNPRPIWHDLGPSGYIDLVTFWNGPPGEEGSKATTFSNIRFNGILTLSYPITGGGPITHVSWAIIEEVSLPGLAVGSSGSALSPGESIPVDSTIAIDITPFGQNIPTGVESEFKKTIVKSGMTSNRIPTEVWSETIFPSRDFITARARDLIYQANYGCLSLSGEIVWDPDIEINNSCTHKDTTGLVKAFTHNYNRQTGKKSGLSTTFRAECEGL